MDESERLSHELSTNQLHSCIVQKPLSVDLPARPPIVISVAAPWENSKMPSRADKKLLKAAAQQPTYAAAAHSAASQPSHSWHIKNSRSTQGETRVALAAKTKFFLHSLCMSLNAFLSLCILLVSAFNCLLAANCHALPCLPVSATDSGHVALCGGAPMPHFFTKTVSR